MGTKGYLTSVLLLICSLIIIDIYGQSEAIPKNNAGDTSQFVSVVAIFDKTKATIDGYYFGGYVVEIDAEQAARLNGKKIKITGKLFIEIGIGKPGKNDSNDQSVISQGRQKDTKHIYSPFIEIVQY